MAYHGVPEKAYEVFMDSYKSFNSSDFFVDLESKNPAGLIYCITIICCIRIARVRYFKGLTGDLFNYQYVMLCIDKYQ